MPLHGITSEKIIKYSKSNDVNIVEAKQTLHNTSFFDIILLINNKI